MDNPSSGPSGTGSAAHRYAQLEGERDVYVKRGQECSLYTIPALFPRDGFTSTSKLPQPMQSVGSSGVNHLSAKLLMSLLPSSAPFFRFRLDSKVAAKFPANMKAKVDSALADMERTIKEAIENAGDRPVVNEVIKHLVVVGNVLFVIDKRGPRAIPLSRYVVVRDAFGNVLEVVIKEAISAIALGEELSAFLEVTPEEAERNIEVYTHVKREGDKYTVYQEAKGKRLPDTDGSYPLDRCPYMPLRMIRIDGEPYGRSYVEEFIGDLKSLEALTTALVEGAAAAAKLLILVSPNGTTRAKTIADAPNGAIREGNAADVTLLQMEKSRDFQFANNLAQTIVQRLNMAFLQNTAVQRDAERVTAEEIRYVAQELEDSLGGVYSLLSQEFQLPYVRRRMAILEDAGELPGLPKGAVKPTIITGIDALGRGHDANVMVQFLTTLTQTVGPEVVQQYVDVSAYIQRMGTGLGVDMEGLIKDDQTVAAEQQQAKMAQMIAQLGPNAINQIGALGKENVKNTGNVYGDSQQ